MISQDTVISKITKYFDLSIKSQIIDILHKINKSFEYVTDKNFLPYDGFTISTEGTVSISGTIFRFGKFSYEEDFDGSGGELYINPCYIDSIGGYPIIVKTKGGCILINVLKEMDLEDIDKMFNYRSIPDYDADHNLNRNVIAFKQWLLDKRKVNKMNDIITNNIMRDINEDLSHREMPLIQNMIVLGSGIMTDGSVHLDIAANIFDESEGKDVVRVMTYAEENNVGYYDIMLNKCRICGEIRSHNLYEYFTKS